MQLNVLEGGNTASHPSKRAAHSRINSGARKCEANPEEQLGRLSLSSPRRVLKADNEVDGVSTEGDWTTVNDDRSETGNVVEWCVEDSNT